MECTVGPIDFRIASGRVSVIEDLSGLPVRYRLDGKAPIATRADSDRVHLWFRDPARATGEDPMVARGRAGGDHVGGFQTSALKMYLRSLSPSELTG